MNFKEHTRSCIISEKELERIPPEQILRHNGFILDLPIRKIIDKTHGPGIRYEQRLYFNADSQMLDGQIPEDPEMVEITALGDEQRTFKPLFEHFKASDIPDYNPPHIHIGKDATLEILNKEYITDSDLNIDI